MSNSVKVKLNKEGVIQLLKDPAISHICEELAEQCAQRAGDGYAAYQRSYPERIGWAVTPTTEKAFFRNRYGNVLIKALYGGAKK